MSGASGTPGTWEAAAETIPSHIAGAAAGSASTLARRLVVESSSKWKAISGAVAKLYMQPEQMRRDLIRIVVDGDVAVVKSRLSGRTVEDVSYDNEYVTFYVWEDGAVVRAEEHLDTLSASQAGVDRLIKERTAAQGDAAPD